MLVTTVVTDNILVVASDWAQVWYRVADHPHFGQWQMIWGCTIIKSCSWLLLLHPKPLQQKTLNSAIQPWTLRQEHNEATLILQDKIRLSFVASFQRKIFSDWNKPHVFDLGRSFDVLEVQPIQPIQNQGTPTSMALFPFSDLMHLGTARKAVFFLSGMVSSP